MIEARWDFPEHWKWVAARDVGEIMGGGTPSTGDSANFANKGIPWITPADLTGYAGKYISRGARDLSEKGYNSSGARLMPPGTVLFSSRAPIGYCVIASNELATNQGFKSLVSSSEHSPEYLRYYLLSAKEYAESLASGTTFKELSEARMANLAIPVPPLPEQRRIVVQLDRLIGRTVRARQELGRIPRLVERYRGALLTAAFQDGFGIENAASCFVPQPLSAAVISTFYGPRIAREAYVSSGIPTLRTTDIGEWGRLCPQDPPQVNVGQQERSKWAFQDGDLMLTRTGATIGKCAIYEGRFGPALPSAYLIRVRLDMQVAVPRFVLLFLLSPKGQRQLLDGRTAVAQPNINANAILSVELPLPPIELQKSIVHRIEAAFAWLDRVVTEHANASRLLPKLDQAILAKAFRGKLVPQDPNDEPLELSAPPEDNGRRARSTRQRAGAAH